MPVQRCEILLHGVKQSTTKIPRRSSPGCYRLLHLIVHYIAHVRMKLRLLLIPACAGESVCRFVMLVATM